MKHLHQRLVRQRAYRLGYMVTKLYLYGSGLVEPGLPRWAHRKKQSRRPLRRGCSCTRGLAARRVGGGEPPLDLDDVTTDLYGWGSREPETWRRAQPISILSLFAVPRPKGFGKPHRSPAGSELSTLLKNSRALRREGGVVAIIEG